MGIHHDSIQIKIIIIYDDICIHTYIYIYIYIQNIHNINNVIHNNIKRCSFRAYFLNKNDVFFVFNMLDCWRCVFVFVLRFVLEMLVFNAFLCRQRLPPAGQATGWAPGLRRVPARAAQDAFLVFQFFFVCFCVFFLI